MNNRHRHPSLWTLCHACPHRACRHACHHRGALGAFRCPCGLFFCCHLQSLHLFLLFHLPLRIRPSQTRYQVKSHCLICPSRHRHPSLWTLCHACHHRACRHACHHRGALGAFRCPCGFFFLLSPSESPPFPSLPSPAPYSSFTDSISSRKSLSDLPESSPAPFLDSLPCLPPSCLPPCLPPSWCPWCFSLSLWSFFLLSPSESPPFPSLPSPAPYSSFTDSISSKKSLSDL